MERPIVIKWLPGVFKELSAKKSWVDMLFPAPTFKDKLGGTLSCEKPGTVRELTTMISIAKSSNRRSVKSLMVLSIL